MLARIGGGGGGLAGFNGTFKYGVGGSGGGSFSAGFDPLLLARVGTGDGAVSITAIATAVPEPAGLAVFRVGLLGFGTLVHRGQGWPKACAGKEAA